MIIQYFLLIFLVFLLATCCSGAKPALTTGPFRMTIVSVDDCSNPGKPFLKNPPIVFNPSVQNIDGKNTLAGNWTVFKDTKDFTMKTKSFLWQNDKWQPFISMGTPDCHGMLLRLTMAAFNINYDKKNCMFLKGFYSFKNIDVNQLQHIWFASMPYTRTLWRWELHSKTGMFIFCKEFIDATEPDLNV